MAGVLLCHAQSASKSICSSAPLSSEYRLGTRVASRPERSYTFERLGGLDWPSNKYRSGPVVPVE
jgi:hypothetical protein